MSKNYQWTAAMTVDSGGYNGELITIEQNGTVLFSGSVSNPPQTFNLPWTTTSSDTGSSTYTYTYRDSDTLNNNNSTKVAITVRDEWTVSIDNRNYMTVTVHTTLVSAVRTRIGSPSNANRHLWMRRSSGGRDYNPFPLIDNANDAHTIASNVDMGTYSFTLAPGENAQRSTMWWRNTIVGHESQRIPNIYTDIFGIGIHFKNILPKDYVPGKTWTDTSTVVETKTGTNITFNNSIRAPLEDLKVGGDTEQQTYSGKNLCNGINQGYWLSSTATTAGMTSSDSGLIIPVAQNTRYAISTTTSQTRYRVAFSDSVYTSTQLTCYNGANRDGTSDSIVRGSETHSYLIVNATDLTKIQVEEGNQATSFEPYVGGIASPNPDYPQGVQTVTGRQVVTISDGGSQSQEYEINLGKNLLNLPEFENVKISGLNATCKNGVLTVTGTTGDTYFPSFIFYPDGSYVTSYWWASSAARDTAKGFYTDANTDYMLSAIIEGTSLYEVSAVYESSSQYIINGSGTQYKKINENERLNCISVGFRPNATVDVKIKLQLERGETSTDWAPYFTPIELCKIGDHQDYIYKSGEDWYLHKETVEMVLDGTETITKPFTNIFVVENLSGDWPKESEAVFYYCEDYYSLKSTGSNSNFNTLAADYGYAFDFTSSASGRNIRLKDTRYDNIDSYKAWLASNNVTVYYAIVTPTDTKITNSDLIRQLNVIEAFGTYNGNTIITVSGNITSPLTVSARVSSNQGIWLSHNRSGGTADIHTDSDTWVQMRTIDGGVGSDNPPYIRHESGDKNQRLIGEDQ